MLKKWSCHHHPWRDLLETMWTVWLRMRWQDFLWSVTLRHMLITSPRQRWLCLKAALMTSWLLPSHHTKHIDRETTYSYRTCLRLLVMENFKIWERGKSYLFHSCGKILPRPYHCRAHAQERFRCPRKILHCHWRQDTPECKSVLNIMENTRRGY